jgi:4-hydroxy-tetrahydrodipicolinate synthase
VKSGTYVALPTPFDRGLVDDAALRRVIRHVLSGGICGVVACGTTGESPVLTTDEWCRVVETCVAEVGDLALVLAGTGTNCTATTVERTKRARELGAHAALVVAPYYNRPGPEGLLRHYQTVADEGGLPVVMYNIPGRTGCNLHPDLVCRLSRHPGIVGIKEASGCLDAVSSIVAGASHGFLVLSGDDSLSLPMYSLGAKGVISTTGNVCPKEMAEVFHRFEAGDTAGARQAHYRLLPLFRALFAESNPAPLKAALCLMGLMAEEVRLPLTVVSPATRALLVDALRQAGVSETAS